MPTERAGIILPDIFFESEVIKFKKEAYQKGRLEGFDLGVESTIMCIHHRSGLSAEQIVAITGYSAQYIQEIFDKFKDHPPKYFAKKAVSMQHRDGFFSKILRGVNFKFQISDFNTSKLEI